ncbi:MAG: hypothetical protein QOE58_2835, partial [Actinomycetota bacterium]|nr:hypothetical protein [Actinomycetota bacterium]
MSHSHDLGSVIDPSERAGDLTPPPGRRRAALVLAVLLLPILVATVVGLVLLWPSGAKPQSGLEFSAAGVTFPQGKVTSMVRVPCGQADKARGCGTATVSVVEGADATKVTGITVPSEVVGAGVGTTLVLTKQPSVAGHPAAYSFYDVKRDVPLVALAVLFAVVTIGVARLRGLLALIGLGFASVVVVGFILPALVDGKSPLWVGLTGASAIIFVVLYLAHGLSLRTTTALLGTFGGLALTALTGGVAVRAAHLSGISGDDNDFLARVAG